MTLARIRRVLCLAGIALGLGAAYACSLNPQPLPPGETADAGNGAPGADAATVFGGSDSGGSLAADGQAGGNPPDASSDVVSNPAPPEGGDAGDAESDAPMDGMTDAPGDAPIDGEEGGG
jgi:hypothetical protein